MTSNIARTFALSVVSAGIIGGAALGMAGMANAATQTRPSGPGYSYAPAVKAHPAPEAVARLARPPRRGSDPALRARLPPLIDQLRGPPRHGEGRVGAQRPFTDMQ